MNRAILEKPFLGQEIRQRDGGHGQVLDYVEGHTVIARLNEAFDGVWDFVIKSFEVSEARDEVIVVGRLVAGGVTKMQFGASSITRSKADNQPISIADDLKAAATDALKKCATLFGVGLHLYRDKDEHKGQHSRQRSGQAEAAQKTNSRISARQHGYLLNLAREQALTKRELDALCQERFGVVLDHVTKAEASLLIEELGRQEAPPSQPRQGEHRAGGVH